MMLLRRCRLRHVIGLALRQRFSGSCSPRHVITFSDTPYATTAATPIVAITPNFTPLVSFVTPFAPPLFCQATASSLHHANTVELVTRLNMLVIIMVGYHIRLHIADYIAGHNTPLFRLPPPFTIRYTAVIVTRRSITTPCHWLLSPDTIFFAMLDTPHADAFVYAHYHFSSLVIYAWLSACLLLRTRHTPYCMPLRLTPLHIHYSLPPLLSFSSLVAPSLHVARLFFTPLFFRAVGRH